VDREARKFVKRITLMSLGATGERLYWRRATRALAALAAVSEARYTRAMLVILLSAFAVSLVLTLVAVHLSRKYAKLLGDHDFSGPQKFHVRVVPRIGGVGIWLGFVGAAAALWVQTHAFGEPRVVAGLLACAVPVFVAGIVEDLTKRVSPRMRLLAAAFSALLAAWLLGAVIDRTDIPGVQWIAGVGAGAVLLAVFVVSGVANAINIIDGMNGLASMCVVIMLAGLGYIAADVGDPLILALCLGLIGAVLGFFIWNYPRGMIFLGDGGAYLLGFLLAELAILLLHRNPEVSPLSVLLLVAYPAIETLFSMYRRKVVRGRSMGMPDGIHLHSLIYRRIIRWAVGPADAKALTRRNSMTAPYLWVLCSMSVVPATLWWDSTPILAAFLLLFVAFYIGLYASIVRFRTPRWLVFGNSKGFAVAPQEPVER
jgi:UDP-N-acetylmuramyl pentapeptide phosphotransferase/UDP-N-acetylglucosamine-1-phosphate transferase